GRSARTRRRAPPGSGRAAPPQASRRPAGCSCRPAAGRAGARSPPRGARPRSAGSPAQDVTRWRRGRAGEADAAPRMFGDAIADARPQVDPAIGIRPVNPCPTAERRPSALSAGRMVDTAAMSGRVTRVSIAPVKSLGLSHPETVELTPSGVVGDRRFWMITDEGRLVNGKLCPELMQIRSAWDEAA